MHLRPSSPALLLALALGACSSGSGGPSTKLTFTLSPADAVMRSSFALMVQLVDGKGAAIMDDNATAITVHLGTGTGTLGGTLTRTASAGMAHFDDLTYDKWESVTLVASADKLKDATTPSFPVRPIMRFADPPSFREKKGQPLGPLTVELVDGHGDAVPARAGAKVTATSTDSGAVFDGGGERTFSGNQATWPKVTMATAGAATLMFASEGLQTLMQAVVVYDRLKTEARWLPSGRVGIPYTASLPGGGMDYSIVGGGLPSGLSLDGKSGAISGRPNEARHVHLEVVAPESGGTFDLYLVEFSIFPELETAASSLDALDQDGPYAVGEIDDKVTVASRGKTEKMRVYFPSNDGKTPADGRFPLVVFHHGAAGIDGAHPDIYLRYEPLLLRWTTWGFVVVTIDGVDLIFDGSSMGTANTLMDLTGMSENQRAAMALMRQWNDDGSKSLAGHIDVDRIIVAGHSRGGGGSVITTRAEPGVLGAILLKPIDPLMSDGGDTVWNNDLPGKAMLVTIASGDADVIYPICDFLYERRTAPMAAHTIIGTVHNYTKSIPGGVCAPEQGSKPQITREQDWAITNVYATAFLQWVGHGDDTYAPLLFGREGLSTTLSPLGVWNRGDRRMQALLVDDFKDGDSAHNATGGAASATGFDTSADEPSMKSAIGQIPAAYGLRPLYQRAPLLAYSAAHRLKWSSSGATYRSEVGDLDVTGRGAFVVRMRSESTSGLAPGDFSLRFLDGKGGQAMLSAAEYVGGNGVGPRFGDVVVPTGDIKGKGVDLAHVAALELVMGASSGEVVIDDLRFE